MSPVWLSTVPTETKRSPATSALVLPEASMLGTSSSLKGSSSRSCATNQPGASPLPKRALSPCPAPAWFTQGVGHDAFLVSVGGALKSIRKGTTRRFRTHERKPRSHEPTTRAFPEAWYLKFTSVRSPLQERHRRGTPRGAGHPATPRRRWCRPSLRSWAGVGPHRLRLLFSLRCLLRGLR
jgi:hypothetical protein